MLRKAAAELTLDRRSIAFIDLEPFKGHTYPDVLLSVLISTFTEFAKWLREAGRNSASKTSFWQRLFGTKPKRPPLDKAATEKLVTELEGQVAELRALLHSGDEAVIKTLRAENAELSVAGDASIGVKAGPIGVSGKVAGSEKVVESTAIGKSEPERFRAVK